ncbi:MAG: type II toxin-antitoxin system HicA family toxin [archaeon]|nr:type II toxin-antitoxin system HicA family toxin [archaeon]
MPKLPIVSSKKIIKVALKSGYSFVRQSGSHIVLKNQNNKLLVIPNHNALKKGTFLQILKQLGITKEKFMKK